VLDHLDDHTVTLSKVDPLLEAQGPEDDVVVRLGELPSDTATLVVRAGSQAGTALSLSAPVTRLGRRQENEISLDDITVSRRHAEITRTGDGYVVADAGSLNGTYVNGKRIDGPVVLLQGDELQVGKFHLVFFQKAEG
jgi:pSer/pThr/pTyr-binding forkhead associated (FHA) protein